MSGGKHASDEEFEFEFDFGWIRNIVIVVAILAVIAGVVFGVYKAVGKLKDAQTEKTSAEVEQGETRTETNQYAVLGKILIDKIDVGQPILDSVDDEALEQGVIKLYGGEINQEREFLYRRT